MNFDRDNNWLVHDHQRYDNLLEDCVEAAEVLDWKAATALFNEFVAELKQHMLMEDEVLYPMLRAESGDPCGDIDLLTYEHEDILQLLGDLTTVVRRKDFEHFEAALRPLHKVLIQHNDHEEMVFLALGTESLLMRREEIEAKLEALAPLPIRKKWMF